MPLRQDEQRPTTVANTSRFEDIDVGRLAKDKALNRHIHGTQMASSSSQYDLIKLEAQALAAESEQRFVNKEREKTMISQQEAN